MPISFWCSVRRLNIRQVSYNWKAFARNAYKIQVDVDPAELHKPTVKPDLPIVSDAKEFLQALEKGVPTVPVSTAPGSRRVAPMVPGTRTAIRSASRSLP